MAQRECQRKACKVARTELAATQAALAKLQRRNALIELALSIALADTADVRDSNVGLSAVKAALLQHQAYDAQEAQQQAKQHDTERFWAGRAAAEAERAKAKTKK